MRKGKRHYRRQEQKRLFALSRADLAIVIIFPQFSIFSVGYHRQLAGEKTGISRRLVGRHWRDSRELSLTMKANPTPWSWRVSIVLLYVPTMAAEAERVVALAMASEGCFFLASLQNSLLKLAIAQLYLPTTHCSWLDRPSPIYLL